jgi:hypothetical protein
MNRVLADATPDCLIEGDDAVMAAEKISEHSVQTVPSHQRFHPTRSVHPKLR